MAYVMHRQAEPQATLLDASCVLCYLGMDRTDLFVCPTYFFGVTLIVVLLNNHESKSSHISKARTWKQVQTSAIVQHVFAGMQPLHSVSEQLDILLQLQQNKHQNTCLFDYIDSDSAM